MYYYGYGSFLRGNYIQLILMLVPFVLCLFTQWLVNSRFSKYSAVLNGRGLTGAQAAQHLLDVNGIHDVKIELIPGRLSDNYDPRSKVLHLSESVYNSRSIAAIGVACHEAGHAIQYSANYFPIKIRSAVIPTARIGSAIGLPLCIISLIFNFQALFTAGIILYGAVFVFQLATLPVEFDASSRALKGIRENNLLDGEEYNGAKAVLQAAALTYVAAMASSLITVIRLLLLNNRRR